MRLKSHEILKQQKLIKKLTERIDFFGNMWYTLLVTKLVLVLLTVLIIPNKRGAVVFLALDLIL